MGRPPERLVYFGERECSSKRGGIEWLSWSIFPACFFATSIAEAFYATGSFDTVSYEKAPSSGTAGDYDLGVTIDLENNLLNTGWAWGDKYYFGTVEPLAAADAGPRS